MNFQLKQFRKKLGYMLTGEKLNASLHVVVRRIGELAFEHFTFGYRRLWALLKRRDGYLC